ncbi:MAG: 4-hydroxy-tetrahydrodipicolinate synthase [Syntrophaceae bacterium]
MFSGTIVAIVTPFKNGAIDDKAFRDLINYVVAGGVQGIVPCGTTGESATLTHVEHERVIDITVAEVAGRVPVIAGTGSNSTDEAISLTRHAKAAGADAALLITPYYNKPTQKGLLAHFTAVAKACDIPLVLYNVPGRTGVNMSAATTIALSKIDTIVGVKEASGDVIQISQIAKGVAPDFDILSGDDGLTLPILAVGGKGVISVTANVMPAKVSGVVKAWLAGDIAGARREHLALIDLHNAMFIETNPIPVKTALALMGKVAEEFKLPLTPMDQANRDKLAAVLTSYGCL